MDDNDQNLSDLHRAWYLHQAISNLAFPLTYSIADKSLLSHLSYKIGARLVAIYGIKLSINNSSDDEIWN